MITVTIPKVSSYADGRKLLDMLPTGYDHNYVNELLSALGKVGREAYLHEQIPVDMLYPGLFAITYSLIFAFLLKGIKKIGRFIIDTELTDVQPTQLQLIIPD